MKLCKQSAQQLFNMSNSNFFGLEKKLLVLVSSATMISILITTILFLNFANIEIFEIPENIVVISISLMIGLSTLTYFLSKRLSGPIMKLSDAANEIAQGNFGIRTNIKTRDEIGQLSISFDEMAEKLQEAKITIKQKEEVMQQNYTCTLHQALSVAILHHLQNHVYHENELYGHKGFHLQI